MSLEVKYEIPSVSHFQELLLQNPGVLIIKFGASWCGPCKRIDPVLLNYYKQMPYNVQCIVVDIDNSTEIYSFMRTKKMVSGVPALLCYIKGNHSYIPDASTIGADPAQIKLFFQKCYDASKQLA
jgi:thioredoxin 1